jgi:hypothetical protein
MLRDEESNSNNNNTEMVDEPGLAMTAPKLQDADPDPCGKRCCAEWSPAYPGWFSIEEGEKTLDIPSSFGPTSLLVRVIKFGLMGWTCATLIVKWYDNRDYPAFFLAYLTHWSLIFASVWLITSFINSLLPPSQPIKLSDSVSLWTKYSWLMFEVAAQFTLIVTLLYWTLDYEPGVTVLTYTTIFSHGIHMILVWTDGLLINRIPVRWKHVFLHMFLASLYIAWLVIHQLLTDMGVPGEEDNDPETNDDLIYTAVDFTEKTAFSSVLCVLVVLVLVPLVHWLLWGLSLGCPCRCNGSNRRYLSDDSKPLATLGKDGRWVVVQSSKVSIGSEAGSAKRDNVNIYEEP